LTLPQVWQATAALVKTDDSGNPENGEIIIEMSCADSGGIDEAFCTSVSSAISLAALLPAVGPIFSAVGTGFSAACA
jgi:hypothetical protein